MIRLIAVTSCPTGIAHTLMAAEALRKTATSLGYAIAVETRGSNGVQNELSAAQIGEADVVILATDIRVDTSRFIRKLRLEVSTSETIRHTRDVIAQAVALLPPEVAAPSTHGADDIPLASPPVPLVPLVENVAAVRSARTRARTGVYKHLMTGVSYMLPLVTAGGLCIALAFALGGIYAGQEPGTLAYALNQIGGGTAFALFVAVLSAFIAYSIADRPGLAPGLVGGMLAQSLGAGFLGGIVSGFLAGYLTKFLADKIRLPATLDGLKPVLILPFLATVAVGLAMIYVIAPPMQLLNTALADWLNAMRGTNAIVLGLLLGAMMAFDMGGPVNKAAYTFSVGLLASKIYTPMAAVMAAGMTPPLALALACVLFKNRFDAEERQAAGPAFVLGLSFITEGAIPFAAKDPLRVIPALMLGSAAAGAISMFSSVYLLVPHGGIFAVFIPGAVVHLATYLLALIAGVLLSTAALFFLKRPVAPAA